jgi:hypothetical protein
MYKATITLAALALATPGSQQIHAVPDLRMKEEAITIEYTVGANEGVVVLEAETEETLDLVEIRNSRGAPILRLQADASREIALSGFVLEASESDPATLLQRYPEGVYDIRGRTVAGQQVRGKALLSHELLAAPLVVYPSEGAAGVPSRGLTVSWVPDPGAVGYRIGLEQGESDGVTARLPPGSSSFQVPDGILEPDTETQLEIGAVAPNGNCTLVEVVFRTR